MRAGGGGVSRLDISSGLPRGSRPLIENILVYQGLGTWGRRWKKGHKGTEFTSKVRAKDACWWPRSLSSGSRGFSWEWLGD